MNTTVYSRIYAGLLEIIPDLPTVKQGDYRCSNVSGSMAMGLDVLYSSKTEIHLELAHHFGQNGASWFQTRTRKSAFILFRRRQKH